MAYLGDRQKALAEQLIRGFPVLGIKGWPLVSASASVGNATQESACLPVNPSKDGSNGLYQWRGLRLSDLQSYARQRNLDWQLMETQAAFHMVEMQRDYATLYADLLAGTKSLETLTADICDIYERPAAQYANLNNRILAAKATYGMITIVPPPIPPPEPSNPVPVSPSTSKGTSKMGSLLSFLFARLNEKSTVAGLVSAFFAAIHFTAPQVLQADLTNAIIAVVGVIAALIPTS